MPKQTNKELLEQVERLKLLHSNMNDILTDQQKQNSRLTQEVLKLTLEVTELKQTENRLTNRNESLQYSLVLMTDIIRTLQTRYVFKPENTHSYRFNKDTNRWEFKGDTVAIGG